MSVRAPALAILAASLAVFTTTACGPKKIKVRPADDLHQDAREFHQDESYTAAIDTYKQLLDNYPLDPRVEEIELAMARAHYADGAYPESIAAFSDFQRMHPTSPELPGVEYSIGQAYLDQASTIDRDLAAAASASRRFESVIDRFPEDGHAVESARKLHESREFLAERELYVAKFYARRGRTPAARVRMAQLIARYPETKAAGEAMELVAEQGREGEDPALATLAEDARKENESLRAGLPGVVTSSDPSRQSRSKWVSWLPDWKWLPKPGKPRDLVAAGERPPATTGPDGARPSKRDLLPPRIGPATAALVDGLRERQPAVVAAAATRRDSQGSRPLGFGSTPGSIRAMGTGGFPGAAVPGSVAGR
jgi:outer membrane protein assembly factor BamD